MGSLPHSLQSLSSNSRKSLLLILVTLGLALSPCLPYPLSCSLVIHTSHLHGSADCQLREKCYVGSGGHSNKGRAGMWSTGRPLDRRTAHHRGRGISKGEGAPKWDLGPGRPQWGRPSPSSLLHLYLGVYYLQHISFQKKTVYTSTQFSLKQKNLDFNHGTFC